MDVKGKVVLVSGANRGLGQALVYALLEYGAAKVYASARNVKDMPDFGDARVHNVQLDITNREQVNQVAAEAFDVDVLINNAGVAEYISAFDGPLEMIARDMGVNYLGTLDMMRAFIPVLEQKEHAAIVNVASIGAFVNFPFLGGYCASKAALFSVTQGARIELSSRGIDVHSVNPGPIDTDMADGAKEIGIEMDATPAEDVAYAILDGVKKGEPDIFPDAAGSELFKIWSEGYSKLEAVVAEMVNGG